MRDRGTGRLYDPGFPGSFLFVSCYGDITSCLGKLRFFGENTRESIV